MQDNKSRYLQNQSINNINRGREDRAIANRNNDLQYAMSRPAEFYQDRDNLRDIKGILASTPAVTTDMNESRNMYQMLMNQMKGGDKGARLIDTSGLPAGATRYGRNLFNDPSKSQGFFGDLGSLFTGENEAAVRAPEYNPFPESGFGEEFYKDEFPIESSLGSLMEAGTNFIPYAGMLKEMLSKERDPLERDSSFLPRNNPFDIEFDKLDNIEDIYEGNTPYNEEITVDVGDFSDYNDIPYEGNDTDIAAQNDINKLEGIIDGKYEIEALRNQIMSNPAGDPYFGNLEDLYGIKANTFDPENYLEENGYLDENEPNIETGIFEDLEPSQTVQENNIIQDAIKKNPWMLRIMGNDYMGIRAYLFDIGVLDPNSDLYKRTSNLEFSE